MTKRPAFLIAASAAVLALTLMAGYGVRVLAEGAPTKQPLFYSGSLEANGALANGDYAIKLSLFGLASGGTALCTVDDSIKVESGRFRVDASACADAIAAEPDVWLAVSFTDGDGVDHAIPGRTKVGAVPYALQAQHALSASAASLNGSLATTLTQLNDRVSALEAITLSSGFLAYKTLGQTLQTGYNRVVFDQEIYDLGGEYDTSTGIFKVKNAGHYLFSCTVAFDVGTNTVGIWEISLQINGYEHTYEGATQDGIALTRHLAGTLELAAGDEVSCATLHSTAAVGVNLGNDHSFTTFSGHRI